MTDDVKQEPMSLADRDKYLVQIEEQIQAKRNLLLGKRKFLESTLKQNTFLDGVKNDYDKYYGYIAKKREEELRAMGILKQYTEELMVSTKMTESDIKRTKEDQRLILDEMTKIKSELDKIIAN
jgi:hypothetical protein